jgi:hypothetical protein
MSESAAGDWDDNLVTTPGPAAPEVAVDPDETLRPGSPEDARSAAVPGAGPAAPPTAVDNTARVTHHTLTTAPTEPPIQDNADTSPQARELSDESTGDADPGSTKRLMADEVLAGDAELASARPGTDRSEPVAERLDDDGEQPEGERLDDEGDTVADELAAAQLDDDVDDPMTDPGSPFPIDDSAAITESDRAAAIGAFDAGSTVNRLGPRRQRDPRKWVRVVRHGYFLRSRTGITVATAVVLIVLTVFGLSGLLMFGNGSDPNTGEAVVFVNSEAPAISIGSIPPELQIAVSTPPSTQSDVSAVQARSVGRVENRPRAAAPPAGSTSANRQPQPTSPTAAPTVAPSQSPPRVPAPTTSNPSTNCWTKFPALATLLKRMGGC